MAARRIALLFLLFFTFYVDGKPTKTPAVTFRGSGRTTPGPDSAGANNTMYLVVLPICGVLVVAAVITIFCCYRAWRRREKKQKTDLQMIRVEKQETDLQMVRVEKPVVRKPVAQIAKKNITPPMDVIEEKTPIIKRLEAAKRGGEAPKEKEKIVKRTSRLKRFRKWMRKRTQKKNKNMGKG